MAAKTRMLRKSRPQPTAIVTLSGTEESRPDRNSGVPTSRLAPAGPCVVRWRGEGELRCRSVVVSRGRRNGGVRLIVVVVDRRAAASTKVEVPGLGIGKVN